MEQIEPALLSRHGSEKANLAHVMSAIQSIRGEGLKTGLISEAGGLNSERIPVDKSLFDVVCVLNVFIKHYLKSVVVK